MLRFVRPFLRRLPKRTTGFAWFAGSYAFFIGLILPFICWGALANPAHPHAGPHFVFADPPVYADTQSASGADTQLQMLLNSYCGDASINSALLDWLTIDAPAQADPLPAGQSLPDSVISLLMLAAGGVLLYTFVAVTSFQCLAMAPFTSGHLLSVPTPPPRFG
ncbi:MAG: hypothetical protein KDD92_08060 [Caldilineaceae bacterium]|nr:hypothetical protein [Caldilineaceae bacterium]